MGALRKYSVESQQRAPRMALEARQDPVWLRGAVKRVGDQLGVHAEALRNWARQAAMSPVHRRRGVRSSTTSRSNGSGNPGPPQI